MMSNQKPTYEELKRRVTEAEAIIATLRSGEVDAIISERNVALLRVKELEKALRRSEESFRNSLERSPLGICVVTAEEELLYANQAMLDICGWSSVEELEAVPTEDRYTPESYAEQQERKGKRKRGEFAPSNYETSIVRKDGEVRHLAVSCAEVIWNGERQLETVYQDITERRKLDQLKDDFILLVSHELRSPLTVIMGAVNTALTEGSRLSPEETRQLLRDAACEAESLSRLVGNLLELTRVQTDRLFLYTEPVSIDHVVQKVADRIRLESTAKRFLIDLPKGLPQVCADELRLECILHNLLENATKQGAYIMKRLEKMKEHSEIVGDVKGKGLMIGMEIVENKETKKPAAKKASEIMMRSWKRGVAVITCGVSTVRIAPPLIINRELVDAALEIIEDVIKEVEKEG